MKMGKTVNLFYTTSISETYVEIRGKNLYCGGGDKSVSIFIKKGLLERNKTILNSVFLFPKKAYNTNQFETSKRNNIRLFRPLRIIRC